MSLQGECIDDADKTTPKVVSLSRCHRCDRNVSSGVSERRFVCFKFVTGFRPTSSLKRSKLSVVSFSKTLTLESAIYITCTQPYNYQTRMSLFLKKSPPEKILAMPIIIFFWSNSDLMTKSNVGVM